MSVAEQIEILEKVRFYIGIKFNIGRVMEMEKVLPTRGQLERQISQTTQALYREGFGHNPSKVVCHIFGDKVVIILENAITSIEKLLIANSQINLVEDIRFSVEKVFSLQIRQKISEILNIETIDLISESSLDGEYVGMVAILSNVPEVRLSRKGKYRSIAALKNNDTEIENDFSTLTQTI